jgi:cytochrome o ubiquinol oxidase subunit II
MNFFSHLVLLDTKGIIALAQRDLLVFATLLMLVIVIPVFLLTIGIAWRYRASNTKATYRPNWEHSTLEEFIWWAVPCIIILILAVTTWKSSHALDPYQPLASSEKPIVIEAVALNWKWLFIYPDEGVATINYLHIPVHVPITFKITADAPMNSFWIPQLGGQIYAMPGMTTKLHLMADTEGVYQGSSANFSGAGFSGMRFPVHVTSVAVYKAWLETIRTTSEILDAETYALYKKPSSYDAANFFAAVETGLFDSIISSYMMPTISDHAMDMPQH